MERLGAEVGRASGRPSRPPLMRCECLETEKGGNQIAVLDGEAQKCILTLSLEESRDYTALARALAQQFGRAVSSFRHVMRLKERQGQPGKCMRALGNEITVLIQQVCPELSPRPCRVLSARHVGWKRSWYQPGPTAIVYWWLARPRWRKERPRIAIPPSPGSRNSSLCSRPRPHRENLKQAG
ncbi:UNVERIFIED_CONTAM: hypothetical protein FKN15_022854 [Acipenser sinensis]